jgi:uncharacterized membrane protein
MNNFALLRPEMLALVGLLPLIGLGARRLADIAPWRRRAAALLQAGSAFSLLIALAGPVRLEADPALNLVLVLDSSASLSAASRDQALSYAREVLAAARPTDRVQVVATARQASLVPLREISAGTWRAPAATAPDRAAQATDLASGLQLAGQLLPATGLRRVVLLTDGWQTQGNAGAAAATLIARGIDLAVVPLPALGNPEMIVEGVAAPGYVRVGDSVASEVSIYSTSVATATLQVSVDGQPVSTVPVDLAVGENTVPLDQKAAAPGFHRLGVQLTARADTARDNNQATAWLMVKAPPRVLILGERAGEAVQLATALTGQQITVEVQLPSFVPPTVAGLDAYDSVILYNVAATSFTLDQQRTLQEYVRQNGRGLVVVGGPTSYARGGYADSVFEDMLPVSSRPNPRPQKGATALILVLDHSGSMNEVTAGSGAVSKLVMAKEAARQAVDAVRDGDSLGVLTFDTSNSWVYPVQQIGGDADKEQARRRITTITGGTGTAIFGALEEAARAIIPLTAPTKHIVLLTDGNEFGRHEYDPLLKDLRAHNVNVSTIGVGSDAAKVLLAQLAKQGEGRYYFTEQANNIPKIVVKELNVSLSESIVEGATQARTQATSPLLRGFAPAALPRLAGYALTTPKPTGVIALASGDQDPLLAHWNYGLGRVVAFTGGAGAIWGGEWPAWSEFGRFWSQVVRWSMASPINVQLQPTITVEPPPDGRSAGVAHLVVASLNTNNRAADLAAITAGVRAPSGGITTTVLAQTAPGRYEATLPVQESGAYEVRLLRRQGTEAVTETAGFTVLPNMELLHAGINDRLLQQLTNGRPYLTAAAQVLDPAGLAQPGTRREPLWGFFLAPGLILLLAGVAARRLDLRLPRRRRG